MDEGCSRWAVRLPRYRRGLPNRRVAGRRCAVPRHDADTLPPLRFGTAARPSLSVHEAMLIEALLAAGQGRWHDLRRLTNDLVFPDLAPALARSLTSLARVFGQSMALK